MKATTSAGDILRGVSRALADADQAVLAELPLGNGRCADLVAIDRIGASVIQRIKVEIAGEKAPERNSAREPDSLEDVGSSRRAMPTSVKASG